MTPDIEKALAEWLATEEIDASPFTALDSKLQPNDAQTVTIFVSDAPRAVGPLYRATCNFIVSTPPLADEEMSDALTRHRSKSRELHDLLASPPAVSLANALETVSSLYYRGAFLRDGGASTVDEGRWITTLEVTLGISTDEGA